jgi:hypothetical protein
MALVRTRAGPGDDARHLFEDVSAAAAPVRVEAERDHATRVPATRPVMSAIPAIRPMIEVDAVFTAASTLSISRVPKRIAWLPQWLRSKTATVFEDRR